MTLQIVALGVALALLGLVPATIARSKRRAFGLWWIYGSLAFVVALPHALLLKRPPDSRTDGALQVDEELSARENLRRQTVDATMRAGTADEEWQPVGFVEADATVQAPVEPATPSVTSDRKEPWTTDRWISVGQIFSPAAPINHQHLFAGRHLQMEGLIDVAFERGRHAVVFGERGVGKTSMATVMISIFEAQGTKLAIKVNCDATDSFDTVWKNVFEEIDFAASASETLGRKEPGQLKAITAGIDRDRPLSPNDVRKALRLITGIKECVIFIDEFERLRDPEAPQFFSDTLKMLSDQQVPATIIIVGVADNLHELLGTSKSIERNLVQIQMPRMSPDELCEIVNRGLALADMAIDEGAADLIIAISRGLPHFTHLIAQRAARNAIDHRERDITIRHVDAALRVLVDKTYETILEEYGTAVFSHRETLYPQVLLAAAMAETDEQGFFAAADLVRPLSLVARKPYDIPAFSRHLHALATAERGPTLHRKGAEHRYRFRFANPLLQPYVLMKGLNEKLISAEELSTY